MISFIFDLQYKMDVEWKNLVKILVFHEEQFNEKIVPKNKLTPEMIADIRRQIQRCPGYYKILRRLPALERFYQETKFSLLKPIRRVFYCYIPMW